MPDIFDFKGGIQIYSAFLLKALQSLRADASYTVCLKHDTCPSADVSILPQTRFHCAGNWPLRLRTFFFAGQLLGLGLRQRPDLVIATHINFAQAAYWLKRFTGIPYWAVAHGIEAWEIKSPALQRALHHADKILAVSTYTRQRLAEAIQLEPAAIQLLPNTFDAVRFQIGPKPAYLLQRYGLQLDQPILLTVARLAKDEQYKGYDRMLEALPRIRQSVPNVHYMIAGKGDDKSRIERLVIDLGLQGCVTLTGFVPDDELCDHYNLCDLFAMPSKGEGFGIVYLEALACGKPTLGGNQDGALDALEQGQLGVLVNPDDVSEIAQAIVEVLQRRYAHPLLYQPQALRQAVIDRFGFEQFTQTLAGHLRAASSAKRVA